MVDFDERCIYITRNRIRVRNRTETGAKKEGFKTIVVNETKNASSKRIVPLSSVAYDILVEACNATKSQYCFPNTRGQVVKQTTFKQVLIR